MMGMRLPACSAGNGVAPHAAGTTDRTRRYLAYRFESAGAVAGWPAPVGPFGGVRD